MSKLREDVFDMGMLKRTAASAGDKLLKMKVEHKDDNGKQHITISYNAGPQTLLKIDADIPAKELTIKNQQGDDGKFDLEWQSADSALWQHGYYLKISNTTSKYTTHTHIGFGADGKFKTKIDGEGRGKKVSVTRLFK